MKRSEIINKMSKYWLRLSSEEEIADVYDDPDLFDEVKERMDNLLDFLECTHGMKPPTFKNYRPSQRERTFSRDGDWGWDGYDDKGNKITWLECEGWEPE